MATDHETQSNSGIERIVHLDQTIGIIIRAEFYSEGSVAAGDLSDRIKAGDTVLFKASRSAAMEKVMNQAFPPNN